MQRAQVTKIEPQGVQKRLKNEASGLHFGSKNGAKMAPGGLRGPLGRQVGSRSLPGRFPKRSRSPPGAKKIIAIFRGASGEISQRDFTLPGGPGGRFGLHFGSPRCSFWPSFWQPVLKQLKCFKKVHIFVYLSDLGVAILWSVWYPVACLAARPAASRTWKNHENPLVFIGRKPSAPFSCNARND